MAREIECPGFENHLDHLQEEIRELEAVKSELQQREEYLKKLTDSMPAGLIVVDGGSHVILDANKTALTLFGAPAGEIIGKTCHNFICPNERGNCPIMDCGQKVDKAERLLLTAGGGSMPVIKSVHPLHLPDRTLLLETFIDISELKMAEQALLKERDRAQLLLDVAETIILALDNAGKVSLINRKGCSVLGRREDEVVGRNWFDTFLPQEKKLEVASFFKELMEGKGTPREYYENSIITGSGEERTIAWHNTLLYDEAGNITGTLSSGEDITERLIREESLSRFKSTLDSTLDCVFMFDPASLNFFYVNQGGIDQLGYSREELLRMTPCDIKPRFDEKAYRAFIAPLTSGKQSSITFETIHRSKSGRDIPVEIFLQFIPGRNQHFVAIVRDITERKNIEAKLRQAYKMEAMGTLAGGIAHEFNNILTAILGFADLAREEIPADNTATQDINEVLKAANRAKELVNQILSFSRQADQKMHTVQLHPIVKEAMKLLRSSTPSTIEILQNISTEDTTVQADPTQVHQLLMNLCTNAVHALEEQKGTIEVELKRIRLQEGMVASGQALLPGTYIELSIRDNGKGMAEDIISRIFDPFFTTKDVDKGTGMGLSVVHGIVESHQGAISVESEVGRGSAFHVFFPAVDDKASEIPLDYEPLPIGSERILFVDDEMVLAHMAKQMLERLGYQVSARTSSLEAFEAFRAQPGRFDLVITDQTMPHLTGEELAEKILAIRPGIPIILYTGYSTLVDEAKAKRAGIREFMLKPIEKAQLAKTIRKVLERK